MIAAAYYSLLAGLLVSLGAGAFAAWSAWNSAGDSETPATGSAASLLTWAHFAVTMLLTLASSILLGAFLQRDFAFKYVAEYCDTTLETFYAVTAFWGGQEGSLLFWALTVAVWGAFFPLGDGYKGFSSRTKVTYWAVFFLVEGFFMLALTNWSNPFIELVPAPPEGRGLNPLLRNPGMVFHPPLLFLGYAGFTVPACAAIASRLAGERSSWLDASRNSILTSWVFLTAGIILGCWWSYMELGWGGYWAWDPVENASLVPWLTGSALVHTALVEERKKTLGNTNVALVGLTLALCFVATYLVRSGVVQSLHAFSAGGIGNPLLTLVGFLLALTGLALGSGRNIAQRSLGGLLSRPGFLVLTAWLLTAIAGMVLLGTLWPVISGLWSSSPTGLDARFYNKACLPLFVGLTGFLLICPWLSWREGIKGKRGLGAVFGVAAAAAAMSMAAGYDTPMAVAGSALAAGGIAGVLLVLATDPAARRYRPSLGAWTVHLGLLLCVLAVAFSGAYKQERETIIPRGQSVELGGYTLRNDGTEQKSRDTYAYLKANITVLKDGQEVGLLEPERRVYRGWEQPFAEVSVIPSVGEELYATLFGVSPQGAISVKVSVNPLINWLWAGGTLMCLGGFLALRTRKRPAMAAAEGEA